jgi:hypothetical protein
MTRTLAALLVAVALSGCAAPQTCARYQLSIDCERGPGIDTSQLDEPEERNPVAELVAVTVFMTALGHILNAIASR